MLSIGAFRLSFLSRGRQVKTSQVKSSATLESRLDVTSRAFPISGHRLALPTTSVLEALVPLGGHWSWQLGAWTRGLCSLSSSVSRAGETVRAPRCSVGLAIRLPPPRSYYAAARVPVPWIPPRPSPELASTHTRTCAIGRWACFYLLTYCSAPFAMIHATLRLGVDPIGENEISRPSAACRLCVPPTYGHAPTLHTPPCPFCAAMRAARLRLQMASPFS